MDYDRLIPIEFEVDIDEDKISELNKFFPKATVIDEKGKETTKTVGYSYDSETNKATFSVRSIPYLFQIFPKLGINYDFTAICSHFNYISGIDTSSPDFLRPEQYEVACTFNEKSGGIIQCRTGWGKGTLITYMVKHYVGNGNILIIGPTLSVLDELKSRFRKYGVPLANIRFVHAAGFMNSSYKDSHDYVNFMKNVGMIIVDEIENVPSSLESIFRNYCTGYKYIYGFSATANKYAHQELTWDEKLIPKLSPETMSVMYFFGRSLAFKESKKKIVINKAYSRIPPEKVNIYKGDNYNFAIAVDNAIMNLSMVKYMRYIEALYPDNVLLVPVKTKKQGEFLYNNAKRYFSTVFWSGDGFESNKIEGIKNYDMLKEKVDNNEVQVLICTQVGYRGVDFQTISDILLVVGTSNAVVTQIVGRAERFSGEIRVWMLYNIADKDIDYRNHADDLLTPILDACNGSRMKLLAACHSHETHTIADLEEALEKIEKGESNG